MKRVIPLQTSPRRLLQVTFTAALSLLLLNTPVISATLDAAIQAALTNIQQERLNKSQESQVDAQIDEAESSLHPSLRILGSYQVEDEDPALSQRQPFQRSARLGMTQPILGIYKNYPMLHAAEERLKSVSSLSQETVLELKLQVVAAYFSTLSAGQDILNLTELKNAHAKRVKELTQRVQIGRARSSDLLTAEAQLAAREADAIASEASYNGAHAQLSILTGFDRSTKLTVEGKVPEAVEPLSVFIEKLSSHPTLSRLKSEIAATGFTEDAQKRSRLPDLDLFANYHLFREEPLDKLKWDAGLQFTWTLYDGGKTSSQLKESHAKQIKNEIDLKNTQERLARQITQKWESISLLIKQHKALQTSQELLEKSLAKIEDDFSSGLASNLDVIQALNSVTQTKRSRDKLGFQCLSDYKSLKTQVGL